MRYHACDTEVVELDLSEESPVTKGRVICATIYVGPDVDFGNGPRIFIDNLDRFEGTLNYFKVILFLTSPESLNACVLIFISCIVGVF